MEKKEGEQNGFNHDNARGPSALFRANPEQNSAHDTLTQPSVIPKQPSELVVEGSGPRKADIKDDFEDYFAKNILPLSTLPSDEPLGPVVRGIDLDNMNYYPHPKRRRIQNCHNGTDRSRSPGNQLQAVRTGQSRTESKNNDTLAKPVQVVKMKQGSDEARAADLNAQQHNAELDNDDAPNFRTGRKPGNEAGNGGSKSDRDDINMDTKRDHRDAYNFIQSLQYTGYQASLLVDATRVIDMMVTPYIAANLPSV